MARWPSKDTGEILDYQLDWSRRLDSGDRIINAVFSLTVPAGLAIASQSFGDRDAKVWLTSGVAGEEAEILCRVDTEEGRTFEQSVRLAITER